MCSEFFDSRMLRISEYPADFIPDGGEIIIGGEGNFTVVGFYKDGEYHIQEVQEVSVNSK